MHPLIHKALSKVTYYFETLFIMEKTCLNKTNLLKQLQSVMRLAVRYFEILAQKRDLSVQLLIDVIEDGLSGNFTYTSEREQGMERAVNILKRFI